MSNKRPYSRRYEETHDSIKKFQSFKWALVLQGIKPQDIAELLHRLIWNKEYTYYANRENLKRIKIQPSGTARSVMDVYRICHSYIPGIQYRDIATVFYYLVSCNALICHYCHTVMKQVHNPHNMGCTLKRLRELLGDKNIKL